MVVKKLQGLAVDKSAGAGGMHPLLLNICLAEPLDIKF